MLAIQHEALYLSRVVEFLEALIEVVVPQTLIMHVVVV